MAELFAIPTSFPIHLVLGAVVFLVVLYIVLLFSGDRTDDLRSIIEKYTEETDREVDLRRAQSASFSERIATPMMNVLSKVLSSTAPDQMRAEATKKLIMAGEPIRVSTFLTLRGVSLFGIPLLYVAYVSVSGQSWGTSQFVVLIILVLFGRMLPSMVLNSRIKARQKKIERSIPDAVDLVVACVEGGLSLDGALMKVVDRMGGPLSDEFRKALHEISLGRPRRDALRDVAERAGVQSLRSFSQAIAHAEQMGVSIADVLRTLGEQLRTRRKLKAQEMAQKAPIKMIPVIIAFILPGLFVVVLGPAFLNIISFLSR